jgi:hypothetical protein
MITIVSVKRRSVRLQIRDDIRVDIEVNAFPGADRTMYVRIEKPKGVWFSDELWNDLRAQATRAYLLSVMEKKENTNDDLATA